MNETWRCTTSTRGSLIVRCVGGVTNYELRSFVGRALGADFATVKCEAVDAPCDVEVRWFGADYAGDETRRLQKRVRGSDQWRDI